MFYGISSMETSTTFFFVFRIQHLVHNITYERLHKLSSERWTCLHQVHRINSLFHCILYLLHIHMLLYFYFLNSIIYSTKFNSVVGSRYCLAFTWMPSAEYRVPSRLYGFSMHLFTCAILTPYCANIACNTTQNKNIMKRKI